ncbi:hypothetical protein [Methylobacter sp.]|uniref:hypothetical protein n=1 Tax=Methylobacter sp. TaxID=2051955 RepID=UPI002489B62A|nr:hypothetical protein [Methylobacter sp.]MDI1279074.1 hypothetical protein [Methylobacter sp.]MDI1359903.1 hypothetical protein [Methylobacter sp.]
MNDNIMTTDIHEMISHWLKTPKNGYLGSDYGNDLAIFKQALTSNDKNAIQEIISNMQTDIQSLQGCEISIKNPGLGDSITICVDGNCRQHTLNYMD